jgi:uncharacterized protein (TIGR02679 family)
MAASSIEFLAGDRLAPLWEQAHRRLEQSGGSVAGGAVHLRALTDDQRAAIDRLLGVRSRGKNLRVDLERLDNLLRERAGRSLVDVVSELVGPVRDRPGERAALLSAQRAMWDRLLATPALSRHPRLEQWLDRLRTDGGWRRLEQPEQALAEALSVLDHLPQTVRRGRGNLSANVLGDAHALDDLAPVGRLVLSALAHLDGAARPLLAAERRRLWADQGVISDETSSTVLTLGLHPIATGPLTHAADEWASADVPLPVPLAAVQSERWQLPSGTPVWVCENPSVIAAAAGTGATVICLEGRPSVAANLLLGSLTGCGAKLRYHGDFGGGGISIGNQIIGRLSVEPWRFCTPDHGVALERAIASGTRPRPLRGKVPEAVWDSALAAAVRAAGVEVEEELVLDLLINDLS